eukprot:4892805-Lingulodinium_polyedra.AAC.1
MRAGGRAILGRPLRSGPRRMKPCGRSYAKHPICTTPCTERPRFSGRGPELGLRPRSDAPPSSWTARH